MKGALNSQITTALDHSFLIPFLSSAVSEPTKQPVAEHTQMKQSPYKSTLSSASQRKIFSAYAPIKDLREGLINRVQHQPISVQKARETRQLLNASVSDSRKGSTLTRKNIMPKHSSLDLASRRGVKTIGYRIPLEKDSERRTTGYKGSRSESFEEGAETVSRSGRQTEIPGVQFRQREKQFKRAGCILRLSGVNHQVLAVRPKPDIKKEKQSIWEKQRMENVDLIISRQCKTFQEMMGEYYRRMGGDCPGMLFSFDSKDGWMKKYSLSYTESY